MCVCESECVLTYLFGASLFDLILKFHFTTQRCIQHLLSDIFVVPIATTLAHQRLTEANEQHVVEISASRVSTPPASQQLDEFSRHRAKHQEKAFQHDSAFQSFFNI